MAGVSVLEGSGSVMILGGHMLLQLGPKGCPVPPGVPWWDWCLGTAAHRATLYRQLLLL